ncbi:xylulokinase [Halobacillus dabanensis]|uniref:Xylulokinase n=1 Tax=Halobacillus dabanensis TaxID=240302 RepID=A0A1I3RZH6_HALDA|nr:FGGY family carbohydrate kinase [Halobacillus dabanensis]SFJ51450.1 xylulokinase [Halobacillus dabanensis]
MSLLGIDIGTTHIKTGIFHFDGSLVHLSIHPTKSHIDEKGNTYYDPEELWQTVMDAIEKVAKEMEEDIVSIGVTSMAESGLLVNRHTGECVSDMIPWFDRRTEEVSDWIGREIDSFEQFKKTGLHNSYKHGLAKILWLKQNGAEIHPDLVWLSASDYIVYKLTGEIGTDYTLAARTYAFGIDDKEWNEQLIKHFQLPVSIFPKAEPSGTTTGYTEGLSGLLEDGIPVAVSGHDHVCTMLAAGVVESETTLNSMGTAETLLGSTKERKLGKSDFESGFSFGCHVLPSYFFWLGSIQSSGGSVEWLRKQYSSDELLSYKAMNDLLKDAPREPTGILYYPYLAGSGAPKPDPRVRAAFIGLKDSHQKGDIYKALLEGTVYELRSMIEAAEDMGLGNIKKLVSVGGGTKNQEWMDIKANVTNREFFIPQTAEVTLLGAALVAGLGAGIYSSPDEIIRVVGKAEHRQVSPDKHLHQRYSEIFTEGYLPLQGPLRDYYASQS